MKYYKNLIKRKKYKVILICCITALLGFFCFYINLSEFFNIGIKDTELSPSVVVNSGMAGIIGETNIGMAILGLFIIYIGLVFLPKNSIYAQDDSDYEVKLIEDNIYIKFKNNEFLVKKETFAPTDLFFKDKNGKFVTMTRGYQIYNYVEH